MAKIITDSLVIDILTKRGITEPGSLSAEDEQKILLAHYDSKIVDDYRADTHFYTEESADGYELFIATDDERHINVNDDIYYYESDWFEKLPDAIRNGERIQADDYVRDYHAWDEAISECYEDFYQEIWEEVEYELEEQGYEYEKQK